MTATVLRAAALLALPALAAAAPPRLEVRVDGGVVAGAVADGVASWKGVPYAAPPLGERRWRAPQPVEPWTGVRPATQYANDCMQQPFPSDAAPLGTSPAEDCLYVNVWAPEKPAGPKLPVMFWIHGGGFVNVYDGSAFARRGIVFVSLNYRLGRFGFFAHPALTKGQAGAPLGNYGYLDQVAALEWVKRNVAAFGGDPGNVTIFGESAGGGSVNTLMVTPLARGLFHKAIVQSGGGRAGGIMTPRSLKEAEAVGLAFGALAGAPGEDAAALAALRKLPAKDVVRGLDMMTMGAQRDTYAGPMIDGTIVAEEPETAFRAGQQARVPYVIGANDREFGFMPLPPAAVDGMLARFGAARDAVVAAYDPAKTGDAAHLAVPLLVRRDVVAQGREGCPPRDRDPFRLPDRPREVRRGHEPRGRGDRRRCERLLGGLREDRRPERGGPPEVARLRREGRRDPRDRRARAPGEARPLEGPARSHRAGRRRGAGPLTRRAEERRR